jgi:hypothetical protein
LHSFQLQQENAELRQQLDEATRTNQQSAQVLCGDRDMYLSLKWYDLQQSSSLEQQLADAGEQIATM